MTNNYKDNILDYVVNNVTETSGSNVPLFDTTKSINKYITTDILNELTPLEASNISYRGYCYDENSQIFLIYGTYYLSSVSKTYGYIYLVDKNLTKVSMITEFSSGTKLFPFVCLRQSEEGTFYALTAVSTYDNKEARVILLNNIFAKAENENYQVRLRASYFIPNGNNYWYIFGTNYNKRIYKTPGEATYYIFTGATNQSGYFESNYIIKFTINVGMENEWNYYKVQNFFISDADMLIEKNNDTVKYYLYYYSNQNSLYESILENNAITTKNYSLINRGYIQSRNILVKSPNEIYLMYYSNTYDRYFIKYSNGKELVLYQDNDESQSAALTLKADLAGSIVIVYIQDADKYKIGIVNDNTLHTSSEEDYTSGLNVFPMTNVSYNLVNIYTPGLGETIKYILDYNPLNYNGLEYSNYNQTLAIKARLNSNGEMVFARNLYNTTLLGNIATSNLQVPNTLLNDVSIVIESLVGATNGILINDSTPIIKNIYETLYVNFIRSISVIDEDTDTTYPNTAAYINQNINTATKENCESSFIGKVGINYTDNTIIQNISWNYVTDHYETKFVIDATNEVPTLTFMSNDETTMYITKELDLTTGKYYLVSQKLRIE